MQRWKDAHSVTCVLCGGLADERRTVKVHPDDHPEERETHPERYRLKTEIVESVGEGEAHKECFYLTLKQDLDPSGVDLEPRDHR
jgi:hypothetical protein